jgi:hypothetical protein
VNRCAECGKPYEYTVWENENGDGICWECFCELYPHYVTEGITPYPKAENIIAWEPSHNWGTCVSTVKDAWHIAHSSVRHALRSGFYHRAYEPRAQVSWHLYNVPFVATIYANGETTLDYGEHC